MDIALKLKEFAVVSAKVYALKIASVIELDGGTRAALVPTDSGYLAVVVDESFLQKFKPDPGNYFVVSPSGQQTIFSAEVFEDPAFGFAPIQKGQPQ